jgi:thiosulfate dehydrogenase (quinone) large subunit
VSSKHARPWLLLGPPPRALSLAGWALLPLRAFLGTTLCFAGLQKLADGNFFNTSSPSSIYAQILAAERTSPLHAILGHLYQYAGAVGLLIALSELAVGIGTLLGLWTRVAALGGMALSLTLFLTVSYHSHPYYTGSDIVFLFAFTPLLLAGSGGVLSLDQVIDAYVRRERGEDAEPVVPVPFSNVRSVCGSYARGNCTSQGGDPCQPHGCPYLEHGSAIRALAPPGSVERRRFIVGGGVAAVVAGIGLALGGVTAGIGRLAGRSSASGSDEVSLPGSTRASSPTTASSGAATSKPKGQAVGPARGVPVGGAASFRDPTSGDPALVVQPKAGEFHAFDAICPHAGCTVGYAASRDLIVCPCHGSQFNAATGAVEVGPATTGLTSLSVAKGPDGQLYVDG